MTNTARSSVPGHAMREVVAELGPELAVHARRHDIEGTFVAESYALLRDRGYLAAAVPTELGGGGATIAEVAWAQADMARWCPATALASSMHLHVVLTNSWRWRRGDTVVEPMLRKVADGAIVASTGGGDFLYPEATARRVDGGYRISGRKRFVSGGPLADLMATWATVDPMGDPEVAAEAIGVGIPFSADGVKIDDVWDTLGMRGTGSVDVVLEDVFVTDAQVTARRPPGKIVPGLIAVTMNAFPVIASVYWGVAAAARERTIQHVGGGRRAGDIMVQRRIGLLDQHVQTGQFVLEALIARLGSQPEPTMDNFVAVMLAKKAVGEAAQAAVDVAMDAFGGAAYYRSAGIEQAARDVRAALYHPLDTERTLVQAGAFALGQPADCP